MSTVNNVFYFLNFERQSQEELIKDWTTFESNISKAMWRNFHLLHNDRLKSVVRAINGALNDIEKESNSFVVDLTAPFFTYVYDGTTEGSDIEFQVIHSFYPNYNILSLTTHIL
jgi:hypothetical protein